MIGIYIRESSDGQEDNWSHKRQKTCAEDWLKLLGRNDYHIYEDIKSGKAGSIRKNWELLKKDIQADQIDILYFYKYARLGRDNEENERLKKLLKKHKVKFYEEESHSYLDLNNAGVDLITTVTGKQAEIENEIKRQYVIEALKEQYDTGYRRYTGKLYGYYSTSLILKTNKGREKVVREWHINEAEAEIIRYTYELALTKRLGQRAISRQLNNAGYRTRKGKLWTDGGVRNILTKPQYASLTKNSRGEIIESKVYESIISKEDYFKMVEKYSLYFTQNKRGRPNEHLGSGLLYCAKCGAKYRHFVAETKYKKVDGELKKIVRNTYFHKASIDCSNQKMYKQSIIDDIILGIYLEAIETKEEIIRNLNDLAGVDDLMVAKKNYFDNRNKLNREIANFNDAIAKGLNIESVIPEINSRQIALKNTEKELEKIEEEISKRNNVISSEIEYLQTLEVANFVNTGSIKERNTIMKRLIKQIKCDGAYLQPEYIDGSLGTLFNYQNELQFKTLWDKHIKFGKFTINIKPN